MFVEAAVVECISPTLLLQIVPLVVQTPKGNSVHTYALLDSGSQASLILESFAEELGLDGPRDVLTLGTINSKRELKTFQKGVICCEKRQVAVMVGHCTQSQKPGPFLS